MLSLYLHCNTCKGLYALKILMKEDSLSFHVSSLLIHAYTVFFFIIFFFFFLMT